MISQNVRIAAQYTWYDGLCSFPDLDCKLILLKSTHLSYVAYWPRMAIATSSISRLTQVA